MLDKRTQWAALTLLAAILGALWVGATRVAGDAINPTGKPPAPQIDHPAPDFTLATPDGGELTLSDLKGTPVILNFWATWCPPCRAEIPALEAAWRSFDGAGIILGVDVQESPDAVTAFMQNLDMTYPVVLDPDTRIARLYQVRAYPTTYFIDSRGVIVDIYTGPLNEPLLQTRLTELIVD